MMSSPGRARTTMFVMGLTMCGALVTGCSFSASVGEPTSSGSTTTTTTSSAPLSIDKVRLAAMAKQKLEQAAGQESAGVECDDDIKGEVGATQRCTLTATDGTTIGVTATVTAVKGDVVSIDFKADDAAAE